MTPADFPVIVDPEWGKVYLWEAIEDIMLAAKPKFGPAGPELWEYFSNWMNGQTCGALLDGGIVVYEADLEKFLSGGSCVD